MGGCSLKRLGEGDGDGGAASLGALELHPGAVELRGVLDDGESQAGTRDIVRAALVHAVKPLKHPPLALLGNADSVSATWSLTRLPLLTVTVTLPWGRLYLMALSRRL